MRFEKREIMQQFLEDVNEQIAYQPMHAAIEEELLGHMEDKAELYMEYGVSEEEAYKRAVRDMGDASALGIQMNKLHCLRTPKVLLGLILILMLGPGLLANQLYWWPMGESLYFLWGMLLLFLVMRYGYPLLLKYTDWLVLLFAVGCVGWLGLMFVGRVHDYQLAKGLLFAIFSPSLRFGILQMAVLIGTVLLYRSRKHGTKSLFLLLAMEALLMVLMKYSHMAEHSYVPTVTMLLSSLGISFYMVAKQYWTVEKKKGILTAIAGFLALFALFCGLQGKPLKSSLQDFVNPNARAAVTNAWNDTYNNVLIQELLGRAKFVGKIELTEEELIRYGTSQWYYEDGEGTWKHVSDWQSLDSYVEYRMQFLEEPELEDILPDTYHVNYRIAYWILSYGWLPGMLLLTLLLAVQGLLFKTAFGIRNRLGRLVAITGSLALCIQNLFYILGNFGFQFGEFGNLPFISEGWVSITGTAILAGLVLSAYRYDTVVREE